MKKACKDCLHYERYGMTADVCYHPDTQGFNPITGPHWTYADNQRADGKCGPQGRLFERAPPPTTGQRIRSFFKVNDRTPF